MNEMFKLTGSVRVDLRDSKTNSLVDTFTKNNLVVNRGRWNVVRMLVGDNANSRVFSKISFGVGGHITGDPYTAVAPTLTDLQLEQKVTDVAVSVVGVGDNSVVVSATLPADQGNGFIYTEYGLELLNGELFARVTGNVKSKSSNNTITVTWTISVL